MDTKARRVLAIVLLLAVSFAIAYGLRNQVQISWLLLGVAISLGLSLLRVAWIAVCCGPRALLHR